MYNVKEKVFNDQFCRFDVKLLLTIDLSQFGVTLSVVLKYEAS